MAHLIAVDIFTRKAYAQALKSKSTKDVLKALQDIFLDAKAIPQVIASDNGSEWKNEVAEYLEKSGVFHKTNEVGDHHVLGIIDRFSQTIKNMLYKYMTDKDETKWTGVLQKFVNSYNKSEHSALGMSPLEAEKRPIDVMNIHNERALEAKGKSKDSGIKVGDYVRVADSKDGKFKKGYEVNWSLEVFKVKEKHGKNFILDNDKSYRKSKLQKVEKPMEVKKEKTKNVAKKAKADYKQEIVLKREDIKESNVRPKRTVRNNIPAKFLVDKDNIFY
jgi:hypothetical protein